MKPRLQVIHTLAKSPPSKFSCSIKTTIKISLLNRQCHLFLQMKKYSFCLRSLQLAKGRLFRIGKCKHLCYLLRSLLSIERINTV